MSNILQHPKSRQAAGKMVEICRTLIVTVISEFMSPIRLSNMRCAHTRGEEQPQRAGEDNEHGTAGVHGKQNKNDTENGNNEEALKLLCEFARWLAVFPLAVNNILRPATRQGWDSRYHTTCRHCIPSAFHYHSSFHQSHKKSHLCEEAL